MGSPSRFKNGLTNVAIGDPLDQYGLPDPSQWHTYFSDFDSYTAGDWVVTETDAGATQALTAGNGGWLLVTNTAADNDLVSLQKTPAAFTLDATKKALFKCRFKVSDATQSDLAIGLQIVDTTPLAVTDGIWFRKDDGDALLDFIVQKDDTTGKSESLAVGTVVSDTFITVAWSYNGNGVVSAFVDNNKVVEISTASYFPDSILTITMAVQNGEAVAKTMTVDSVFAAIER